MTIDLDSIDGTPERKPGDFRRDKRGTPYVTHPSKRTKKDEPAWERYSRPSGYHHQIEDGYNLVKWDERNIVLGLAGGLVDLAHLHGGDIDDDEWRKQADGVVAAAKREAKSMLAAERGTHAHEITDGTPWLARAEAGEDLGLPTDVQAALVAAWHALLDEHGLEVLATELPVVHDGYRCAGTLDHIARLSKPLTFTLDGEVVELPVGTVLVLDKKTGKLTIDERGGHIMWWQGYAVQCAIYAGSVPYDTAIDRRRTWDDALGVHVPEGEYLIDQRFALIAHVPVTDALDGHPTARLVLVDLAKGRAAADLCKAAKEWERDRAVFGLGHQIDAPASPPSPGDAPPAPVAPSEDVNGTGPPPAEGGAPGRRQALQARAELLKARGATDWIVARWPACPGLRSPEPLSDDQLHLIDMLLTQAEAQYAVPFAEHDATLETPVHPMPVAGDDKPEPAEWVRPDDGAPLDEATTVALRASVDKLPHDCQAWITCRLSEALRAGRPVVVDKQHTERSLEIIRALSDCSLALHRDEELLRLCLGAVLGTEAAGFANVTLGALFGSLTIDEARRLAEAAARDYDGRPALTVADDGSFVLASV